MPHIVVRPREVRQATVSEKGLGTELYEGIEFVERPAEYHVGAADVFVFNLMDSLSTFIRQCNPA